MCYFCILLLLDENIVELYSIKRGLNANAKRVDSCQPAQFAQA